nr:MAG TPA_asm: hypothetical protein [Caudoviricetes sp.]
MNVRPLLVASITIGLSITTEPESNCLERSLST